MDKYVLFTIKWKVLSITPPTEISNIIRIICVLLHGSMEEFDLFMSAWKLLPFIIRSHKDLNFDIIGGIFMLFFMCLLSHQ